MPGMRSSSTLARILQALTLANLGLALAWFGLSWRQPAWIALAPFAIFAMCYSGGLAFEFLLLSRINRSDPVPQAGWFMLLRAWLVATVQGLRVFGWRQPFRWKACPDLLVSVPGPQGQRGVVFVHGFFCNRGFWTPWLRRVAGSGRAFVAVNLEPVFGSIDDYVPAIEQAVAALTRSTGLAPVLVCHSMGGLAARAWLRAGPHAGRVHHVVTIGTPHGGTWLGRFSRFSSGGQMALGSVWLRTLADDSARQPQPRFTCWYSNCDNIVFPSSTATFAGAQNRLVAGAAHVALAFDPQVMAETLALLDPL